MTEVGDGYEVDPFRGLALGVVSTPSFPAIVGIADAMVKSAAVTLVGYEMVGGGLCSAVVRGRVADVRLAVEDGVQTAKQFGQGVSSHVIPRPMPNLEAVLPIGCRLAALAVAGRSRLGRMAVGLLETRGFPAMVGAVDSMLKAADVSFQDYEKVGAGLCTAIIRGQIADVAIAIEAGMQEAERIGELNAVMIIPMPIEEIDRTLPTADCWIEKPMKMPIKVVQKQKQQTIKTVELKNLSLLKNKDENTLK